MRPLRLGIIGTGIATRDLYWPELKKLKSRIKVVAVANRRRRKAEAFARLAGVKTVCASGEELLKLPEVEAVLLSLPIPLNAPWILKALRAGKHVLCEKPIAASLAEGRRLLKELPKFRRKLLIGENYFFTPHMRQAARWVKQGRLGRVRLVECTQLGWMTRANKFAATYWRKDPKYVGGFVVDAGVHVANIARECFGMPKVVKPLHAQFHPQLKPVDTAVAALQFPGGALGVWKSCFSALSRVQPALVRAYGSKATMEVYAGRAALMPANVRGRTVLSPQNGFYHQFAHFHEMVVAGKKPAFSPAQALADLEFMEALIK